MQQAESRIGGVALAASATIPQPLTAIEAGPVKYFLLNIFFNLESTDESFVTLIQTGLNAGAPSPGDDADRLLTALFELMTWYADADTLVYNLAPSILRRVLAYLNTRDMAGSFMVNGATVPEDGDPPQAFTLSMVIPVSLENLFVDGQIFISGSERFKPGYFQYTMGDSLTPTVVLNNGSAVVSGLSIDLRVFYGVGEPGDIAPIWQAAPQNNLSNIWSFEGGQPRIGLFDVLAPGSNPGVGITFEDLINMDPTSFASTFAADRLVTGGYDLTQSWTPYGWVKPGMTFAEWVERARKRPRIEITSGVSVLNVIDVRIATPPPALVERVAQMVGSGGETHFVPVLPKSVPGGKIAATTAALLPIRIRPGAAPAGSPARTVSHPAQAATMAGNLQALYGNFKARVQTVRGKTK